jgi:uncharacterized protein YqjF (DUF2071 family)
MTESSPLFRCAWGDTTFLHYQVDPDALLGRVPFELDLYQGRAWVSVVTITIRPISFRASAPLLAPQSFMNVRTYVREGAITFLAGWLPNPLCALLGPRLVGIPYRLGRLTLEAQVTELHGRARAQAGTFEYRAAIDPRQSYRRPQAGSLEEFLLERYVARTRTGRRRLSFRIWHEPWRFVDLEAKVEADGLLRGSGDWYRHARLAAAHHSPGFEEVGMGRLREVRA